MTTSIISGIDGRELVPQTRRDLRPRAGQVLVVRPKDEDMAEWAPGIAKPETVKAGEAFWSRTATVVRIGPGEDVDFAVGDEVVIEPTMFREIELSPGATVWLGPCSAVKAIFEQVPV